MKVYVAVHFDGFQEGYVVLGAFSDETKAEACLDKARAKTQEILQQFEVHELEVE